MNEKTVIRTGGMSCAACSAKIEKAINKLNGIISVNANFSENTVYAEFDPDRVSRDDITETIRKAGYDVLEGDDEEIAEKERKANAVMRRDLFVAIIFAIPLMFLSMGPMFGLDIPLHDNAKVYAAIELILCIPVIYSGRRFYLRGIPSIVHGSPTMDSLIALGTLASLTYSLYSMYLIFTGDDSALDSLFFDSAAMIIALISVGKYLESRSKLRTADAVRGLMDLAPDKAEIEKDGKTVEIEAKDVKIGDIAVIRPGQSISVDGIVIEGSGHVNESMLTGESIPAVKEEGSKIYSGTVNNDGSLRVKVDKEFNDTMISQIVRMVRDAQGTKAPIARIADRVSAVFVPVVILIAAISALLWFISGKGLEFSLIILVSVLVISCPCSLGLATPMAITVGTGRAAEYGILFRNASVLERAGNIDHVIFDKTGTLTEGDPEVNRVDTPMDVSEFLSYVASAESRSEHPLGKAITKYAESKGADVRVCSDFKNIVGKGIRCSVEGKDVAVGSVPMISEIVTEVPKDDTAGMTRICAAIGGSYSGSIYIADPIRSTSAEAVGMLKSMGIGMTMVTGDSSAAASRIASEVGITDVESGVLPEGKITEVKKRQAAGKDVAMVGDGINDSPALIQSDIGMAVSSGTDIAVSSADVILMNDDVRSVPYALTIGKATLRNIKQNLFFAFCYNAVCIPIAAGVLYLFGIPEFTQMPMLAALAMSCSSISVVTNSLRLRRMDPEKLLRNS